MGYSWTHWEVAQTYSKRGWCIHSQLNFKAGYQLALHYTEAAGWYSAWVKASTHIKQKYGTDRTYMQTSVNRTHKQKYVTDRTRYTSVYRPQKYGRDRTCRQTTYTRKQDTFTDAHMTEGHQLETQQTHHHLKYKRPQKTLHQKMNLLRWHWCCSAFIWHTYKIHGTKDIIWPCTFKPKTDDILHSNLK